MRFQQRHRHHQRVVEIGQRRGRVLGPRVQHGLRRRLFVSMFDAVNWRLLKEGDLLDRLRRDWFVAKTTVLCVSFLDDLFRQSCRLTQDALSGNAAVRRVIVD